LTVDHTAPPVALTRSATSTQKSLDVTLDLLFVLLPGNGCDDIITNVLTNVCWSMAAIRIRMLLH
jgi:hypothetical protein